MKNIFNYLILLTAFFASVSFGQSRIVEGDIFPNIWYEKNHILNFGAEKNVTSGVSATMTVSRITSGSHLLHGLGSFQITPTSAGQTFSVSATTLMPRLIGAECQASFEFTTTSGTTTNYYASVLSGTTTLVSGTITATSGTTGVADFFIPCPAQTNVTSSTPQVSLRVTAVASTSTQPLVVDKLYFGKVISARNLAAETGWLPYTPTLTGGTFSVEMCNYKRRGDSVSLRCVIAPSALTSSAFSISLPNGWQIDASKLSTATDANPHGNGYVISSVANAFANPVSGGPYVMFSDTAVNANLLYLSQDTNGSRFQKDPGDEVLVNGARFAVMAYDIPITGLTPFSTVFDAICPTPLSCQNLFTAQISTTGVVSNESADWINGSCSVASTSDYTCTYSTGVFTAAPACYIIHSDSSGGALTDTAYLRSGTHSSSVLSYSTTQNGARAAANVYALCVRGTDFKLIQAIEGYLSKAMSHSGDSVKREAWATFGGAGSIGSPSNCTASPCTRYGGDSVITGSTRTSTGLYTVAIAAGAFTSIEQIDISTFGTNNAVHCQWNNVTTTSIGISCSNSSSGAATDWGFGISVKGNRGN